MSEKRTEIGQLGEFGLIDKLALLAPSLSEKTLLGIGDDAAILKVSGDILLSTDMLVEGIHFDLSYMPLMHLGYKAVSVNVSDIAAMNGTPHHITVNIGLSNRFSVEAVETLYKGIFSACKDFKIDLVGGDTTASQTGLLISVSIIGSVQPGKVVKRSGAGKGDIICVSGDLGAAYLGLQVLEREKQVFQSNPNMQPDIEKYQYMVQRQLKPVARMDVIHELAEQDIVPTSMIDVSDGLGSELLHISKASGVGVKIYEENLPLDRMVYETAVEFKIDSTACMLNGGEDYELLFTIQQSDYEKLKNHPDIHFIGYVQDQTAGNVLITKSQHEVPITAQGWNHFNS